MTYNAEIIAGKIAWSWKVAKPQKAWDQICDFITGARLVTDDEDDRDGLMWLWIVANEHRKDYF